MAEDSDRPARTIGNRLALGASWLFVVAVAATAYEVVLRYFFNAPTIWANELTLFVCAIAFVLSGVFTMSRDEHLRITALYDLSPAWLRRLFDIVQYLAIASFCIGLCVFGFDNAWKALSIWQSQGSEWNPPIPAVVKPLIVAAAFAMLVLATINFLRRMRK